jgi:hypothetical protein
MLFAKIPKLTHKQAIDIGFASYDKYVDIGSFYLVKKIERDIIHLSKGAYGYRKKSFGYWFFESYFKKGDIVDLVEYLEITDF